MTRERKKAAPNSRRDHAMIAAAERMAELLRLAGDAASEALEEYDASPRWCGLPGLDSDGRGDWYPGDYLLTREQGDDDSLAHSRDDIVDERTAVAYHHELGARLVRRLHAALPPARYEVRNDGPESPRHFLDRVRAVLRWEHRLDSPSLVTNTFALLQCVRKGPRQRGSDGSYWQDYGYRALAAADIDMLPKAVALSGRLLEAFQHADLTLMPQNPSPLELDFLAWIDGRGGGARLSEVAKWIDAEPDTRGRSNRGQGMEMKLLRTFCEKDAPKGAHVAWRIRPAARTLLNTQEAR